jgi:hypothetical protein
MNATRHLATPNRTRQILEDLEAVRENLLALSDDIWDSIDRREQDGGVRPGPAGNRKAITDDRPPRKPLSAGLGCEAIVDFERTSALADCQPAATDD